MHEKKKCPNGVQNAGLPAIVWSDKQVDVTEL